MSRPFYKRKELYLIAGLLVLALLLWLLLPVASGKAGTVTVYVENEVYTSVPFGVPRELVIDQGDGRVNVLCITQTGMYMQSATCRNQDCIHQGTVTAENISSRALGGFLICLPNRVSVELTAPQR